MISFRMAEKKKEAEAAVELMAALYERICIDEKNKKGLIISKATYGKISDEELDEGNFLVCQLFNDRGSGRGEIMVLMLFHRSKISLYKCFHTLLISPLPSPLTFITVSDPRKLF